MLAWWNAWSAPSAPSSSTSAAWRAWKIAGWATGETGERFRNPNHLYSEDLDLFGKGSLFELLSIARTRAGEDFLASWLLAPASQDEVAARHEAVRELRPMLDLREDLAVLGATVRSGLDPDAAARWGEAPEVRFPAGARYHCASSSPRRF